MSDCSNPDPFPKTILLIDSHKEDREYWAQRLSMASPEYYVLEAETGEGGLAISRWQRVDCVVIEQSLPDMSGFKLLIKLVGRVHNPEIPVIMLTRVAIAPMKDLALRNGAQAYLVKDQTSGDAVCMAIHKAITKVPRSQRSFGDLH